MPQRITPAFLITIDVEGDRLWAAPQAVSTENAGWLPRFQTLCERYGLKPTYLTDYEMALSPVFVRFGCDVVRRDAAEIGTHLHAWNTPPICPITPDDSACGPYAFEYHPDLIAEKLANLTRLLECAFETNMTSHRAGRWGFDCAYARILLSQRYWVDCSVTPGVSWKSCLGRPNGSGGPDYTHCQHEAYYVDLEDIRRPGNSGLLELPVTIMPVAPAAVEAARKRLPQRALARRALNRLFPPLTWLRPSRKNRARQMLRVLEKAREEGRSFVEFMLHSSELMPGGSPAFPDEASIEDLYQDLDALFSNAAETCRPASLSEFSKQIALGRSDAA